MLWYFIKLLFEPLTNELKPVAATSVQYFRKFAGYRVIVQSLESSYARSYTVKNLKTILLFETL